MLTCNMLTCSTLLVFQRINKQCSFSEIKNKIKKNLVKETLKFIVRTTLSAYRRW